MYTRMSVLIVILIFMNSLDLMSLAAHITRYATAVAMAAPRAPQLGMSIAFNTVFTTADNIVVVMIVLLFFTAENRLPKKVVKELNSQI